MKQTILNSTNFFSLATFLLTSLVMPSINAAPPAVQTPSPVIYLADNLDEKNNLGFCIDTLGLGWSEQLQTHTCKPEGGDVQFSYKLETHQIESVEFPGKCATLHQSAAAGVSFDLMDCAATSVEQKFIYSAASSEFMPEADHSLCLAVNTESTLVGESSMTRALALAPCASTEAALKQWVVKD